jgi:hypothetical protein
VTRLFGSSAEAFFSLASHITTMARMKAATRRNDALLGARSVTLHGETRDASLRAFGCLAIAMISGSCVTAVDIRAQLLKPSSYVCFAESVSRADSCCKGERASPKMRILRSLQWQIAKVGFDAMRVFQMPTDTGVDAHGSIFGVLRSDADVKRSAAMADGKLRFDFAS